MPEASFRGYFADGQRPLAKKLRGVEQLLFPEHAAEWSAEDFKAEAAQSGPVAPRQIGQLRHAWSGSGGVAVFEIDLDQSLKVLPIELTGALLLMRFALGHV